MNRIPWLMAVVGVVFATTLFAQAPQEQGATASQGASQSAPQPQAGDRPDAEKQATEENAAERDRQARHASAQDDASRASPEQKGTGTGGSDNPGFSPERTAEPANPPR